MATASSQLEAPTRDVSDRAARARDEAERAVEAYVTLYVSAYVAHRTGTDVPPEPVARAARSAVDAVLRAGALMLWLGRPVTEAEQAALREQLRPVRDTVQKRLVRGAADLTEQHYRTLTDTPVTGTPESHRARALERMSTDTPWQRAAARTLATRLAAETTMQMRPVLERLTGILLGKTWVTRGDARVRGVHRTLAGEVRAGEADFWRDVTSGGRLRYPGDPQAPPSQTANCRCTLLLFPLQFASLVRKMLTPEPAEFSLAASVHVHADVMRAQSQLEGELARLGVGVLSYEKL